MPYVLAIDAGTTGITALIVDEQAIVRARGYREFPQHFPQPGWVEHDPDEIWTATVAAIRAALDAAGIEARDLAGIGITDQRETTVLWRTDTLEPVANAIVWQDRRTAGRCDELRADEGWIRAKTGLVLDAYFSATKIEWLLARDPSLAERARAGAIRFGTIDTWLVAKLTGGTVHATDPTNASRTLLYDIYRRAWDEQLLERFGVPASVLPEVRASSGDFGTAELFGARIPIGGIAGDQQAALFGQACFDPGDTKNTYGTGSFVLMNLGEAAPEPPDGLLVTLACGKGGAPVFALEGAIFVTGAAIQWLRDGLGIIANAAEAGPLAESVPDAGGVVFVPALTGLGSPHWDPYARGTILGITRGTTRAHLARAAIEAMVFQTCDVVEAMQRSGGVPITELKVDGGAAVVDLLCQRQADELGVTVRRPTINETTAMGAAFLAGLHTGVWSSTDEIADAWMLDRAFEPGAPLERAHERWENAVAAARGFGA